MGYAVSASYLSPVLAAFACAICYGTAAVLQKISADKEKPASSLDARLLLRLFRDKPYAGGIALDILGWLLTLYAVQHLPLFLVEAIIAANIAVTALIERAFRRHILRPAAYLALTVILAGLVLLALAASPERAAPISSTLRWLIVAALIPIGLAGASLVRRRGQPAAIGLAILGGCAFAGTSIVGRIFSFSHPVWHTIYSPLTLALMASGILGILLFSTALGRAQATVINAAMTASQVLIATVIGIVFLGDYARSGRWSVMILGSSLTLAGVVVLALGSKTQETSSR